MHLISWTHHRGSKQQLLNMGPVVENAALLRIESEETLKKNAKILFF
jgi:hypothetical protein